MLLQQITALIKKDILLEYRQKHTFFGVLLYIGCTVFVLFMMAGSPTADVWNALFWVAQLFITVNTVAKSFLQEGETRNRYYYTLVSPLAFVLSKLIYAVVLMVIMALLALGLFNVLMENPLHKPGLFILVTALGASALSLLFTFLSAIAAQARNNAALMAILGFPIAIPILMILNKLSLTAVSPVIQNSWTEMAVMTLGMDVLIIVLSGILFPFLWKE